MKKYLTEAKYISFNAKKSEKSENSRRRWKKYKRENNKLKNSGLVKTYAHTPESLSLYFAFRRKRFIDDYLINYFAKFQPVEAPENFSLIDNPEEVISFINILKDCFDREQKVFVSLKNIKKINHDAIVVLLSIMIRFKAKEIEFNGNLPRDFKSDLILRQSGFFKNLYQKFEDIDEYSLSTQENFITYGSKEVMSWITAQMLEDAALTVCGEPKRCNGVQTTLIELMQNTFAHATPGQKKEKHWWLSVNHSPNENIVRFSFVDYGVGIFKSLENKSDNSKWYNAIPKMIEKFKYGNNAELLRLILNGDLHRTVTGEYYRGQGLPGISETMNENWFSNVHIITNDVFADLANENFKVLRENFSGTFIYWEISPDNKFLEKKL